VLLDLCLIISSGAFTVYSGIDSYCSIFDFLCVALWIIVYPFVIVLLTIVLSVVLLFTGPNNHFGIFKLFFLYYISLAHFLYHYNIIVSLHVNI